MSTSKKQLRDYRKNQILSIAKSFGYEVQVYSDTHLRIFGETIVDYWPSSGKCWKTGTHEKSHVMTPEQAVACAHAMTADEVAMKHMESIRHE